MNFHDKLEKFSGYVIVALIACGIGYYLKASQGPAKVQTESVEKHQKEIASLKKTIESLRLKISKFSNQHKSKTKVLVKNADGSSSLTETETSDKEFKERLEKQSKLQNEIYDSMIEIAKSAEKQKVLSNIRNIFGGVGYSTEKKIKGIVGASAGMPGFALTSDGKIDHAFYGTLNFQF